MIWYEDEVKGLERQRLQYQYQPETIFYGSSTIRLWDTLYTDFKDYKPVNLGFGGSTLEACVYFFDRLIAPLHPKRIVFYAGDNDLGDGRRSEDVFRYFEQLMLKVRQKFGDIPFAFISIKPSIVRWGINDKIRYTNQIIRDEIDKWPQTHYIDIYSEMIDAKGLPVKALFVPDGLHLSSKGYDVWRETILKYLQNL